MGALCSHVKERISTDLSGLVAERKTATFGDVASEDASHLAGCGECLSAYSMRISSALDVHPRLSAACLGMDIETAERMLKEKK